MSFYKAFKAFVKECIGTARDILLNGKGDIGELMRGFYVLSRKNHLLEKKRTSRLH